MKLLVAAAPDQAYTVVIAQHESNMPNIALEQHNARGPPAE